MNGGVYNLIIKLSKSKEIRIGRLGTFIFPRGFYVYTGSAQNGLGKRIDRHFSNWKKLHWHIDYLLNKARVETIIYAETSEKKECWVAQALSYRLLSIPGFGCSDCRCFSHLFFSQDLEALNQCIFESFKQVKLASKVLPIVSSDLACKVVNITKGYRVRPILLANPTCGGIMPRQR